MENQNELKLLHPRSTAAVIRDGYRLYLATFRRLSRSSWPVAIVYGIAFALMMGNLVNNLIPLQATMKAFGSDVVMAGEDLTATLVTTLVTTLFFALAALLLAAQDVRLFSEHKDTAAVTAPPHWYGRLCLPSFLRLLAVALWMVALSVIIDIAFAALVQAILSLGIVGSLWKSVASIVLLAILALAVIAALVPLAYTTMRNLLADKLRWAPPVKGYVTGLRHWGLLFATLFVVYILTELLSLVCELPAVIMAVANAEAYAGLAIGDPLGLPQHIVPLTYCVFAIAGFIQAYVHLSTLFPLYYAYGSIEQQEGERLNIER